MLSTEFMAMWCTVPFKSALAGCWCAPERWSPHSKERRAGRTKTTGIYCQRMFYTVKKPRFLCFLISLKTKTPQKKYPLCWDRMCLLKFTEDFSKKREKNRVVKSLVNLSLLHHLLLARKFVKCRIFC